MFIVLLESKADNTAHANPIIVKTSIKIISMRFFSSYHFCLFCFICKIIGNMITMNSMVVPPIKPNAFIISGKRIAIPPAEDTTSSVKRKCSHALDYLLSLKRQKIYSLHGAYSRVAPLNTLITHPILPISIR